jgi:hypothetical protein
MLTLAIALGAALGCGRSSPKQKDAEPAVAPAAEADPAAAEAREAAEHHRAALAAALAALGAGTYAGPFVGAMNMHTSVLSEPAWPADETPDGGAPLPAGFTSVRLGYLRHGAKVPVLQDPIINDDCLEGWYELVYGGFVCGRAATLDLKNPRVRLAPHPPKDEPLPYQYGYNVTNGTPLYRRVLSVEDRKKYEPWLAPPPPAQVLAAGEESDDTESDPLDAGVAPPGRENEGPDAALPWFMRTYDGGKPKVTLDDLHGRGVLVRRMVRGFYLALDRDFKAAHAHWWRTTAGFAVPFDRVVLQPKITEFHGIWLHAAKDAKDAAADAGAPGDASDAASDAGDAGAASTIRPGTVGFAMSSFARKYSVDLDKGKVGWGDAIPKRAGVELTGVTFSQAGGVLAQTTEGFWVRPSELLIATPTNPPADLEPNAKWIDVDLTKQLLVAFEGDRPAFATLVSSGKRNANDKDKDHPTPSGAFRIREKHVSATMDGDVAADGPYSIEDVPWVMYFEGSYALHGAFWHGNFGHMMSHGCVNLSPADARSLFGWTEPHLPDGWHGVFASDKQPGTRVVIHE